MRIEGVTEAKAGWFVRLTYWFSRRRFGKVIEPAKVMAHNLWIMSSFSAFELGLEKANKLELQLKELAQLKAALMVGCPW